MPINAPHHSSDAHAHHDHAHMLRSCHLKATPKRLRILQVLADEAEPVSAAYIYKKCKDGLDETTVYRTLEALVAAGVIAEIDLRHGHAHYELAAGRAHHHHAVCTSCGAVEDIEACDAAGLQKAALSRLAKFAALESHALEFFGTCRACAA